MLRSRQDAHAHVLHGETTHSRRPFLSDCTGMATAAPRQSGADSVRQSSREWRAGTSQSGGGQPVDVLAEA